MRYLVIALSLLAAVPALGQDLVKHKFLIDAPAPYYEPAGMVTPDGTFNIRDENAPFHSDRLADAMNLDADGRLPGGGYLNLNHAVFTTYRLAGDEAPLSTVLIIMPGTWAGSMSLHQAAYDILRLAAGEGAGGVEVWLLDRRSEQVEDHAGVWHGVKSVESGDCTARDYGELFTEVSEYYRPAFRPDEAGLELMGRKFTPLDHDALRFMGNWGADVAIRDWRQVVLEAHRRLGNEVTVNDGGVPVVKKQPGKHVFIGGHSLGGSLTVLYGSYDFDRRPDKLVAGYDDVDGLVLFEGGSAGPRELKEEKARPYLEEQAKKYAKSNVYFDMNMLGIAYTPSTMLSVPISGFAASLAPDALSTFPDYSRPSVVRMKNVTNAALLGYALDDDTAPFFIARVSFGAPSGELWRQFRPKSATLPMDPGEGRIVTPWWPGHVVMDKDFVYGWKNIDQADEWRRGDDTPEVTDFHAFAASIFAGPPEFDNAPDYSRGPNDFAEWYFPPRLSFESRNLGVRLADDDGTEFINSTLINDLPIPVISFVGDDSMGQFREPSRDEKNFVPGALAHPATDGHILLGYTHLDIMAATRNFQPDLPEDLRAYNGCAVYAWRFMKEAAAEK